MNIRQALQNEIMELQNEADIFGEELNAFYEFLEQDVEMDWERFMTIVAYFAGEYWGMYLPEDIWGGDE